MTNLSSVFMKNFKVKINCPDLLQFRLSFVGEQPLEWCHHGLGRRGRRVPGAVCMRDIRIRDDQYVRQTVSVGRIHVGVHSGA